MITRQRVRAYYELTKPGMVYGNVLPALAGYAVASTGSGIHFAQLLGIIGGLTLIMASSCVVNNIRDRQMDRLMRRTHRRSLAQGVIGSRPAGWFAGVLLVLGAALLALYGQLLALVIALFAWWLYAHIYTTLKRRTSHATLVGSLPGAAPPLVGYTALTGSFDVTAALFTGILICWQMVHFYAIALRAARDYARANIPVHPLVYGEAATVRAVQLWGLVYLILIGISTWKLPLPGLYGGFVVVVHLVLLYYLANDSSDPSVWATRVFLSSIGGLSLWSIATVVAAVLG